MFGNIGDAAEAISSPGGSWQSVCCALLSCWERDWLLLSTQDMSHSCYLLEGGAAYSCFLSAPTGWHDKRARERDRDQK